jgi:hypothetical protein
VAEKAEGFVAIDKDGELVALGDKVDCNHALAPWAKQLADSEPSLWDGDRKIAEFKPRRRHAALHY